MKAIQLLALTLTAVVAACAPTTGPVSLPVEVLVVLDVQEKSLQVVPVDSVSSGYFISLAPQSAVPVSLAVHGQLAAVGLSNGRVQLVDLAAKAAIGSIPLNPNGQVSAVAFSDNGDVFGAQPSVGQVWRAEANTGIPTSFPVHGGPTGFGVARGSVFIVVSNREGCPVDLAGCPNSPSWLASLDHPGETIQLTGPGNANSAALAPDGFLYVLSSGNGSPIDGRLSQVNPVSRAEENAYGPFGPSPQFLASDGGDRILVASSELMVFNIRTRQIERGVGSGVPLTNPRALAVDGLGRTYVVEAGPNAPGQIRVFGTDLVELRHIPTHLSPIAAAVTEIPANLFQFVN